MEKYEDRMEECKGDAQEESLLWRLQYKLLEMEYKKMKIEWMIARRLLHSRLIKAVKMKSETEASKIWEM